MFSISFIEVKSNYIIYNIYWSTSIIYKDANLIKCYLFFRINGVMCYNIIHRTISDAAADECKEQLKESKDKIDIEALVKQNEDLLEENKNLTVCFKYHIYI